MSFHGIGGKDQVTITPVLPHTTLAQPMFRNPLAVFRWSAVSLSDQQRQSPSGLVPRATRLATKRTVSRQVPGPALRVLLRTGDSVPPAETAARGAVPVHQPHGSSLHRGRAAHGLL